MGVGMSAQGFDRCTYYQRLEDSFDPRADFIFEGIGADELLGDFGIIGGGAAGSEIDFYNPSLGTPPDTLVLATSGPLSDTYLLVAEELYEQLPGMGGTEQPSVRSDLVYGPSTAAAASSRSVRSPGPGRCPTTATTTTSPGSPPMCCAASATPSR